MAEKNIILQDEQGDIYYPRTKALNNFMSDGNSVEATINDITQKFKCDIVGRVANTVGEQVITVGFRPRMIKLTCIFKIENGNNYSSIGVYDGSSQKCISKYGNGSTSPTSASAIVFVHSGAGFNRAMVTNVSETGFTLTWDKTGDLPSGTIEMLMECCR